MHRITIEAIRLIEKIIGEKMIVGEMGGAGVIIGEGSNLCVPLRPLWSKKCCEIYFRMLF